MASTNQLKSRADALWAQCIKHRDMGRCRRCKRLCRGHAHHIMPRYNTRTRWLFSNGLYLCSQCHDVVHKMERDYGMTPELQRLARQHANAREWAERAIRHMEESLATNNFSDLT